MLVESVGNVLPIIAAGESAEIVVVDVHGDDSNGAIAKDELADPCMRSAELAGRRVEHVIRGLGQRNRGMNAVTAGNAACVVVGRVAVVYRTVAERSIAEVERIDMFFAH